MTLPGFRVAHTMLLISAYGQVSVLDRALGALEVDGAGGEVDGVGVKAMEGIKQAGAVPSKPDVIETGGLGVAVVVVLFEADSIAAEADMGAEKIGGSTPEKVLGMLGSMRLQLAL